MSHKELGKIRRISFGFGGYQDAQLGFTFSLGGDGWGTGDFWGHWGTERSASAKWTEEDRHQILGQDCMKVLNLLKDAKKNTIEELEGVPVEVTFDSPCGRLISWRILKEVL